MARSELSRALFSIFGALLLSTTFVVAAVGPAKAAVPCAAAGAHSPAVY